jgi:hypothetical protein
MNGVSSQRPAGCCTTNQKHSCSLEKDGVRCSAGPHRRRTRRHRASSDVERQVNNESRSERLCGLETFFQLSIDKRALNDQIALTWGQPEVDSVVWLDPLRPHVSDCRTAARYSSPLERVRRTGSVQFSSVSPFTRPNSAVLFVTSRSPSVRACAAIKRSLAPIIWPRFFRSARISA